VLNRSRKRQAQRHLQRNPQNYFCRLIMQVRLDYFDMKLLWSVSSISWEAHPFEELSPQISLVSLPEFEHDEMFVQQRFFIGASHSRRISSNDRIAPRTSCPCEVHTFLANSRASRNNLTRVRASSCSRRMHKRQDHVYVTVMLDSPQFDRSRNPPIALMIILRRLACLPALRIIRMLVSYFEIFRIRSEISPRRSVRCIVLPVHKMI